MDQAPNFVTILANIAEFIPLFYKTVAAFVIFFAIWVAFLGILDLAHASTQKRHFSTSQHASGWGGIGKLLIAGVLLNFAVSGQVITVGSSLFFENNTYTFMSLDSYVPSANDSELKKYLLIVMIGFTQAVGVLAIFKGLRLWVKATSREVQNGFTHGCAYLIFGVLCVQIGRVIGVVQASIGYNFLKLIGLG